MPRVSKKRELSLEKQKLFLDDLYSAITSLKDKQEVRDFFEDLLTAEEKLMLAKRFQGAMMLRLGYLWEEIDERIKVTLGTIARVNQRIIFGQEGLAKVAERILEFKREKLAQLEKGFEKESLASKLTRAGIGILIQEQKRRKKRKSVTS